MTDIRKSLENLADVIEKLDNKPAPMPQINDRELSGNKINGGRITNFSSVGIKDEASNYVITVKDDGIHVSTAYINTICNSLKVQGTLNVDGPIFATKLHVDEISADIRNERSSPLEFKTDTGLAYGKGLIWTGGSYTKQFILQSNPDRLWTSEDIDLHQNKTYQIGGETVITKDSLGTSIVNSNLKRVGSLESLRVEGHLNVDEFLKYNADTQQLLLGASEANGMLTMESWDHQFIIDPDSDKSWKLGTWTTSSLNIITDDTTRLSIGSNGNIIVHSKTGFLGKVGIGVKNFSEDADLTVAGPIRMQDKKFEVLDRHPSSGNYNQGDIVYNSNPKPTGYIGWVCVKDGAPGEWKPFGQIAS